MVSILFFSFLPQSHLFFNKLIIVDFIVILLALPINLNFIANELYFKKNYKLAQIIYELSYRLYRITRILPGNPFNIESERVLRPLLVCYIKLDNGIKGEKTALELLNYINSINQENNQRIDIIYSLLGIALKCQGKYDESRLAFQKAIEICENDPLSIKSTIANKLSDLSANLYICGEINEALKTGKRALALRSLAPLKNEFEESTYAMNLNNLGNICVQLNDFDQAIKYFNESLEIKQKNYGKLSKETVLAYNNLGWCYLKCKSYIEAKQYLETGLNIANDINFITENKTYKYLLNNIGLTYLKLNNLSQAEKYLFDALKLFKNQKATEIHECYMNLALFYVAKENFKEARKYFSLALKLKEKLFGSENFNLREILSEYALFLKNQGNIVESINLETRLAKIKI